MPHQVEAAHDARALRMQRQKFRGMDGAWRKQALCEMCEVERRHLVAAAHARDGSGGGFCLSMEFEGAGVQCGVFVECGEWTELGGERRGEMVVN